MSLDGTVALVTGASSGIGEATARRLAEDGAAVAAVARRSDRLEQLVAVIEAGGGRASAIEADVGERTEAEDAVSRAVSELGRLDVVVNNAGVMLLGPILDSPVSEWERMVEVNLLGLLYVSKAALPHLLEAAAGEPRRVAFSESLRQGVTGRHVRVSLVEPGAVATELVSHNRPEIQEQLRSRFGDVECLESLDIADAISYVVTRPRHVAINEVLVRPTEQTA